MKAALLRYPYIVMLLCLFFAGRAAAKEAGVPLAMKGTPLTFLRNEGQVTDQYGHTRKDIDFSVTTSGINSFIGAGAIHYQWSRFKNVQEKPGTSPRDMDIYRMDMVLEGANTKAIPDVEGEQGYYERYYKPGHTEGILAHAYNKITYRDIYPNIDWVIYTNNGQLKYDFIVHPGGNAANIKLRYDGSTGFAVVKDGIQVNNPVGSITEHTPYAYDAATGKMVDSRFRYADNHLSFEIADHAGAVVIDPAIDWATYFGGTSDDFGHTVATDTAGYVYFSGTTNSSSSPTNYIATSGAYQSSYAGNGDAFIAKFDKNGTKQWATYFGGSGYDDFFSSAIDTSGNLYVTGLTNSSGLFATSPYQSAIGGGYDAMLVKFNPSGSVVWGTYFGGSGDETNGNGSEFQVGLACESKSNSIYLCGNTKSTSGIAGGTYSAQSSNAGGNDGYLAKFTSNGGLIWSTYFGGTGSNDRMIKIVFDATQNVYVAGETESNGLALNGHQSVNNGSTDAFLVKYNSSGYEQWATYYGGSGTEELEGLVADANNFIYMSGSTTSSNTVGSNSNVIATNGAYQTANAGINDCFLVKFNASGVRQWGTFFGGTAVDHCGDMTIDAFGNICFTGQTASLTGIATANAYQLNHGGTSSSPNFDGFLAIFTVSGFKYYSSYFGGAGSDYPYGLKYSKSGDLYMAGYTLSTTDIATSTASQGSARGGMEGFLVKFKADTSAYFFQPYIDTLFCAGDSIIIDFGITNPFRTNNVFTLQLSDASGNFTSPVNLGTFTSTSAGTIRAKIPLTTAGGTGYRLRITSTIPASISFDNAIDIHIKTMPVKPTSSSNSPICTGGVPLNLLTGSTTPGVSYTWIGPNSYTATGSNPTISNPTTANTGPYYITATLMGCTSRDTLLAQVNQTPPPPSITGSTPICSGSTLTASATNTQPGVKFYWKGPGGFSANNTASISIPSVTTTASGYYVVTDSATGCYSRDSISITVNQTYNPSVTLATQGNPVLCPKDSLLFIATGNTAGASPSYMWQINKVTVPGQAGQTFMGGGFTNNDKVRVVYIGSGPCLTKPADTSAAIVVTVTNSLKAGVGITDTPGLTVSPYTHILFTAHDTAGGSAPLYQWVKNGVDIPGAISPIFIGTASLDLNEGDIICVRMKSNASCADPDTASYCLPPIHIDLGVKNTVNNNGLQLYPNPNNGIFTVKGKFTAGNADMEILNAVGQVVYSRTINVTGGMLQTEINTGNTLPNGVYTLRIRGAEETKFLRFIQDK